MSELKVSVSGIRGIWGDSLTLESIFLYISAFGEFLRANGEKTVLLGRDARPTGKLIAFYAASILNAMGFDVTDCGIVPTPTVLFGVRKRNMGGGIIITASHNPIEWNALKFVKRGGVFTGRDDVEKIKAFLGKKFQESPYNKIGKFVIDDKISDLHIEEVMKNLDCELIRKKNFKVLFDPVNSAGSLIGQWILVKLGCNVKSIHSEITGSFERGTEPTPENLKHISEASRSFGADVSFCLDPDADRLVVADEEGKVLSEEMTLALAVENVLSRNKDKKGDVVINMSTSRMVEDIAQKYKVKCFRSRVGEANVVEEIQARGALIGGEGNGGVIYPKINIARDSLVGMGLILELMARTGKKLTELVKELPKYEMRKDKFDFSGDLSAFLERIKAAFPGAKANELDGLRLDWQEGSDSIWLHIRSSNTEPVVRVIGEAPDRTTLNKAFDKVMECK